MKANVAIRNAKKFLIKTWKNKKSCWQVNYIALSTVLYIIYKDIPDFSIIYEFKRTEKIYKIIFLDWSTNNVF